MNVENYKWLFISFASISFFYILREKYLLGIVTAVISIIYLIYIKELKKK